jgi:hypothetical protein
MSAPLPPPSSIPPPPGPSAGAILTTWDRSAQRLVRMIRRTIIQLVVIFWLVCMCVGVANLVSSDPSDHGAGVNIIITGTIVCFLAYVMAKPRRR